MSGECDYCSEHSLECKCHLRQINREIAYEKLIKLRGVTVPMICPCNGCQTDLSCGDRNCLLKDVLKEEVINHPAHYQGKRFEVIDIIEDYKLGFNLGNALKYILRAAKKGNKLQDLKKALWYIERECEETLRDNNV